MDVGAAVAEVLAASPYRSALIASSSWSHSFLSPKNGYLWPDHEGDRLLFDAVSRADYGTWRKRTLADMENLRKRTEREVADARTYGISSFARDVLSVADNIQRALEATGEDWKKHADEAGKALFEGVELTERDLLKALEKQGIRRIDPNGQRFDPNLHQAMYEVADENIAPGTVVQVLQAGFTIGDRILRPAMVAVAKGGPKPEPNQALNDN